MPFVPVLTFLNNKGGVGKTSLVYHLAWMFSELGYRVLACDLDPQANLTSTFLDDSDLESIYEGNAENSGSADTIYRCVKLLTEAGDLVHPELQQITDRLSLLPGDLALAGFEDTLSTEWPKALDSGPLYRPFRVLCAFYQVMQWGAGNMDASIILADVGPTLSSINRSALIASNYVVVPVGADLFSLRGLSNLGPTLRTWRSEWRKRADKWDEPKFILPSGDMGPIGYVVQQHSVRLSRPVKAYDKWVNKMPRGYAVSLLDETEGPYANTPQKDENSLATIKHYRSLVPMAQEARKPVFKLTSGDGAIGGHAGAVTSAYDDFRSLARNIIERMSDPPALPT